MDKKSSVKTPILLNKVAKLTSIRDIDVFEFSFLKTIAELLNIHSVSIYRFNNIHEPCLLLTYINDNHKTDNRITINESKEIQFTSIKLPDEIKKAKQWIDSTGMIFSCRDGDLFHVVYPIQGLNGIAGYLSLYLNKLLTEPENLGISSLLSISHNFHELLEENQQDKLTGLLNRKTFDENVFKIQDILNTYTDVSTFEGVERRSTDEQNEFWLAILDIDDFKRVNDDFGHIYGDEILLLLSQLMRQTFRPTDLLFRYGGEEFIVIIEVENAQAAKKAFERFREKTERFPFPQVGQVTISLGATRIVNELATSTTIVGRADRALYHAKDQGKNKLYLFEDLINKGILEDKVDEGDIELF